MRSAAAAPFRLLQVLEVDRGGGRRQTRRIRRSKFDEAKLQRFGQQAGSSSKDILGVSTKTDFVLNKITLMLTFFVIKGTFSKHTKIMFFFLCLRENLRERK